MLSLSVLLGSGASAVERDTITKVFRAQNPEKTSKPMAPAWRPDNSSEVLVMVQAFYDGTGDLEAKFKQTYWNPTYGEAKKTSGKLKLKKPGKMVWDYGDGQDADYYANGDTLWMVEHDTRQVIKTSTDGNSEVNVALKFLFGGEKLTREFEVRYAVEDKVQRYGDADHYVLELRPKAKNKHYKGLVLMVHATTGRVDSFVVYNTDGSSNYFQLKGIKTNVGITDKLFDFKLPAGYVETIEE
ncbi:Outer membrane lipoprotein carrier protein LolA [Enhygromyxa salina]|uniref:Outer membrane lipoprotein carrier protein LolA n=1 Tax=Enhygromyxa salina TaxID=215803 RepID=A0A0C2CW40_9BACT|nr:outer membrane lipoprotein carrier protein LolA [Enhygromyxa salina]KIG15256.1 Outer membrane lipoprotein carrier protein LolA [Enhygromyxa salina]